MSEEDLLRGLEGLVPPAESATTRTERVGAIARH